VEAVSCVFANGGLLYTAPVGASLTDLADWTPLGHTSGFSLSGWADDEQGTWGVTETLAGRTVSFSFKVKRCDIKRMFRLLNIRRSPAEIRRSAMRSEYHRRAKRR